MARDYRHGHVTRPGFQRKSQQNAPESGLNLSASQRLWLGVALVSVLLIGGFFVVKHFASQGVKASETRNQAIYQSEAANESNITSEQSQVQPDIIPEAEQVEKQPQVVTSDEVEEQATRFTFYEALPQTELHVEAEPLSIALPEPEWLQAGSFPSLDQAQRELARLTRAGLVAEIAPIKTAKGEFYRIVSGPFHDRLEMNKARNAFRRMGADTMSIKLRRIEPNPAN